MNAIILSLINEDFIPDAQYTETYQCRWCGAGFPGDHEFQAMHMELYHGLKV